MAASLSERIVAKVPDAAALYHRLLLVVGPPRSGKTAALRTLCTTHGWPLINVNLRLAELLLELTQKQRALRVPRLLGDLAADSPGDGVMLDGDAIVRLEGGSRLEVMPRAEIRLRMRMASRYRSPRP